MLFTLLPNTAAIAPIALTHHLAGGQTPDALKDQRVFSFPWFKPYAVGTQVSAAEHFSLGDIEAVAENKQMIFVSDKLGFAMKLFAFHGTGCRLPDCLFKLVMTEAIICMDIQEGDAC